MPNRLRRTTLLAALLAGTTATALTPAAAAGPATGLGDVRVVAHFAPPTTQTPENLTLEPDGSADVTFAVSHQIAHVTRDGRTRILATLPTPPDGGAGTPVFGQPIATGISRALDGTLYVLYVAGSADVTGVWRLTPGSSTPERVAALPADSIPNGMALDQHTGTLYIADSNLGTIWTVPAHGGTPVRWASAPELAPVGDLGANGLKLHDGAVWATNTSLGTLLRIPVDRHGRPGPVETRASGLGPVDDFAFTGEGDQVIAAVVGADRVVLIDPDGTSTTVLTAADGLQSPTSVAVRGRTVYVTNSSYAAAADPSLLLARLRG